MERRLKPDAGRRRGPFVVVPILLLATIPLSRLDPSSGSHAGQARPLAADLHVSVGPALLIPIALAVAMWFVFPRIQELPRAWFLSAVTGFGWIFAVTLITETHLSALTARFVQQGNYWSQVPIVERMGPRAFDAGYPGLFPATLPLTHAAVHPQGALLFLWAASRFTGSHVAILCVLIAVVGSLGAIPTYFLARDLFGELQGRRAATLFACSPGILLFSPNSMDPVFVTVIAIALVGLVRAPGSKVWALIAGALTTVALCFTFGALALGPIYLGIVLMNRGAAPIGHLVRRSLLVLAGLIGAALVVRLALSINLIATFRSVQIAQAAFDRLGGRDYRYWVWADAAAFFISVGLGHSSLFFRQVREAWDARSPGLETVLLTTLVALSLSGVTRGETDRIWLFFVPILCASAVRSVRDLELRGVAVAGLAQALVIQTLLVVWGR